MVTDVYIQRDERSFARIPEQDRQYYYHVLCQCVFLHYEHRELSSKSDFRCLKAQHTLQHFLQHCAHHSVATCVHPCNVARTVAEVQLDLKPVTVALNIAGVNTWCNSVLRAILQKMLHYESGTLSSFFPVLLFSSISYPEPAFFLVSDRETKGRFSFRFISHPFALDTQAHAHWASILYLPMRTAFTNLLISKGSTKDFGEDGFSVKYL